MASQMNMADDISSTSSFSHHEDEVVVMVTPYSTGCCVARDIVNLGYKVICLWNKGFSENMKKHVPKSCAGLRYHAELNELDTIEATIQAVHDAAEGCPVVAVICGGEAGVDLTDVLSEQMGLMTNGTHVKNRRDKKAQQEIIAKAGLRACRQAGGSEFHQVEDFLKNESYPVIVKPGDSAGSDGVKLCHTFEEAKKHFLYLSQEHELVNGGACEEVLCQEFLKGREFVVDQVSFDGIHKTMMVWVYDKRNANGASFVYFGDIPFESDTPEAKALIPYARNVLDALGVKYGPSHGEFIMTADGPCLVEMNCRCHGGDGIWEKMVSAMTGGYNQVSGTIACYLQPEKFQDLPDRPGPFKTHGQCVDMVSFSEGIVKQTPGYERIRRLPSFVHLESSYGRGSKVSKTVDMITDIGNLIVMHHDAEVLAQDIAIIRSLERENAMFVYEDEESEEEQDHFDQNCPLERKLSIAKETTTGPVSFFDAMAPSMYLERKLSIPKEDPSLLSTQS